MKTREQIITSMCYTFRHDYGLDNPSYDSFVGSLISGITQEQRDAIWKQMAQIFDNDILPYMEFKKCIT